MQVMREMGLEDVLEKISHIDTRDGIGLISVILLNAFMQKERQMYLKDNLENKANGYYERKPACLFGKSRYQQ